jgi:hypothetical protein
MQQHVVHWKSTDLEEHVQGQKICQASNQCEARNKQSSAYYLFHAGFLLSLFFNHEDGGNKFLQNISWLSIEYRVISQKTQLFKLATVLCLEYGYKELQNVKWTSSPYHILIQYTINVYHYCKVNSHVSKNTQLTNAAYQKEMAENKMWVLVWPVPPAAVTAETAKCSIYLKVYTNSWIKIMTS